MVAATSAKQSLSELNPCKEGLKLSKMVPMQRSLRRRVRAGIESEQQQQCLRLSRSSFDTKSVQLRQNVDSLH